MRNRLRVIGFLLAAAVTAVATAAADWLVLTDGGKVETRGAWEVRGGLVVFTSTAGTLSSLRASAVDLAASERATADARRPAAQSPPPAPRPKARVVLTEKDLPPVVHRTEEEEPEGAVADRPAAPSDTSAPAAGDSRLAVLGWDATTPDDYDGTVVSGRLRNLSDRLLTRVALEVTVYNASGTLLARTPADLDPGPVAPDRVVDFEARFPELYGVTAARFDARGEAFLEGPPGGAGGPAGEAPAAPEPEP